jgi:predicted nucleotidyltransferase
MLSRQEVIVQVRRLKGELATRFDVREIGIIGNTGVPGDNGAEILCLLAEFGPLADLLTFVGLRQFLEDQLEIKIHLVSRGGLRPGTDDLILHTVVFI